MHVERWESRYETKTQTAFRWTVEDLFEHSQRVYLWTFTLVEAMPSWWIGPTWQKLQDWLRATYFQPQGVRVFEWHRDHGLHIHMLVNRRIGVNELRRFARRLGFGRIHVVRANLGAALYLAKYLGKDRGKIPFSGRAWARIGRVGVAVNAIEYRSPEITQRKRRIARLMAEGKSSYEAWIRAESEQAEAFLAHCRKIVGARRSKASIARRCAAHFVDVRSWEGDDRTGTGRSLTLHAIKAGGGSVSLGPGAGGG